MKKALIISIGLNVLITTFFIFKRYYYSTGAGAGQSTYYDQWNSLRRNVYSILPIDSNDIVFIGDSQTECFPLNEFFGDSIKNRGIGGNQTGHILQRLSEIVRSRPKKIFIEAGVNDVIIANNPDKALNNYKQIIASIRKATPRTRLYVQSVFPVCFSYSKNNKAIVGLNNHLAALCQDQGIEFINIYPKMARGSQLDSTLTEDGLHLNGKGYKIWATEIEPFLK